MKKKKGKHRPRKQKAQKKSRKRRVPSARRPGGLPPLVLDPQGAGLLPGKMSDALLHVARPLIDALPDPDDPKQMRALLQLAALAWNVSRLESAEKRQEVQREMIESTPLPAAEEREELRSAFSLMLARAEKLWPTVKAVVADVMVEDAGDELRIQALSALPGSQTGLSPPR